MKQIVVILMSGLMLFVLGCNKATSTEKVDHEKPVTLETETKKISYSLGYNIGMSLKEIMPDMDFETIVKGMYDAGKGKDGQMSMEEMQKVFTTWQQQFNARKMQERQVAGEKNLAEGKKFLEENAKVSGIKVTASGLQYQVLKEGTGLMPKSTDIVKVNYKGSLLDGTEFDNSYKRGQPATFQLNNIIPGWIEGLQLMKVGAKYKFFVPSELGYKDRGSRDIGPNAVLIFEIELLGIEAPAPTPQPGMVPQPAPQAPAPKPTK